MPFFFFPPPPTLKVGPPMFKPSMFGMLSASLKGDMITSDRLVYQPGKAW